MRPEQLADDKVGIGRRLSVEIGPDERPASDVEIRLALNADD